MKKIRLTESELTSLIKNIVNETEMNEMENFVNPEAMETGDAILTIVGTVIGMLGIAGSHYIKAAIKKLRRAGKDEDADKVEAALKSEMSNLDTDPTGMRDVMKKRYNKDMGISDEESMMESRIARRIRRR